MLGMEALNMMFAAGFGGLFGVAIGTLAHQQTNKFNMRMMEEYWNADIKRLQSHIEVLDQKISTLSVDKHVVKVEGRRQGKSYNQSRHFNQRG